MTKADEPKPAHKGLYSALAAAQAEMGRAAKDTNNPHFKSKYADLASVMDACMPSLSKHGIAVLQPPFDDATGRYVRTIFVHGDSGETAECRVPLIVDKDNMQGYGSAATYARRYGLMGMAGIAPDDDDGNAAAKAPPRQEQARPAQRDNTGAADHAQAALSNADSLEQLRAIFEGLPAGVRSLPEVIGTKDNRKAELQPKTTRPADSADADEIPYEGK